MGPDGPDEGAWGDDDGDPLAQLPPILGYHYQSRAVVAEGHDDGREVPPDALDLTGRPGTRAPHLWLERDGARLSTLDLFDGRFVLLAGAGGEGWCEAARQVAASLDIALEAYRVATDGDLIDPDGEWGTAYAVSPAGAVLVRPDATVGWRSVAGAESPLDVITQILPRILCRE